MVTEDDVKKLAVLARLYLSDEEVQKLTPDLNKIFDYMEILNQADIEDIEPLSHVHGITNVSRPDKTERLLTPEQALSNVPNKSGTFIKVPIIIEESGE